MVKTDCKKCKGWYNSCSPDWFADYITDPEHCEFYELDSNTPTSSNNKYTAPQATPKSCWNCLFFNSCYEPCEPYENVKLCPKHAPA